MPVVEFLPAAIQVEVPAGTTVLQAARQAGLIIEAPCDGIGTCGKCKVRRLAGQTVASSSKVNHRLSAEEQAAGWILACQEEVAGHLRIELAAVTESGLRITSHGSAVAVALDPFIGKIYDATAGETMVVTAFAVLGREDGDTSGALFGLAVDIGTTTLVVALIDLHSGREVAIASRLNPQALHAQDVLSRIRFANNEAGLVQLQREVIAALNALILEVSQAAGIAAEQIYEAVFSGNTCMLHLAVGRNPAALGQYPYFPELRGACHYSASELDLRIAPFGLVYLPSIISAYVGADITSGLLATRLDRQQRTVLLIDIGTNGEMVLVHQGKLYATSTAAGPAFEGMNISCGMRAGTGAIERVTVNGVGEVDLEVINGGPARGLCGSGLLDAVSELVRTGVVTAAGGFAPRREELPAALQTRLTQREGKPVFVLEGEVFLSRSDIRQVQLAKGAVRAGVELLLRSAGIIPAAVDEVLIAGAFGFHLRPESLLTIGLLPQEFKGRITFVGNTSKTGGQAFLVNQPCRGEMERLVREIEVVELAVYADFEQVFIASLRF